MKLGISASLLAISAIAVSTPSVADAASTLTTLYTFTVALLDWSWTRLGRSTARPLKAVIWSARLIPREPVAARYSN